MKIVRVSGHTTFKMENKFETEKVVVVGTTSAFSTEQKQEETLRMIEFYE